MDRCACGCPQDRHRMGRGPCLDCSRYDCERFEPTGFVEVPADEPVNPLTAEVYAEHFPVELLTTVVAPELPAGVQPGDQTLLESFNAWRCPGCGSRSFQRQRCEVLPSCRSRWLEPVRVEIHSREVIGGRAG